MVSTGKKVRREGSFPPLPLKSLPVALFGRVRRSVLGLLFARPDEALHLREIVRRTGCGVGAVQREVRRLSGAGILRLTRRGNLALYQPDPACVLFPELKSLVVKTSGVADVVPRRPGTAGGGAARCDPRRVPVRVRRRRRGTRRQRRRRVRRRRRRPGQRVCRAVPAARAAPPRGERGGLPGGGACGKARPRQRFPRPHGGGAEGVPGRERG